MAGVKQTPRQQMIGIMYLVLLAMLAMNASKDLLDAFIFLEDGIDVTTKNFNSTNTSIYTKISRAAASGADVAIEAQQNALNIEKLSNQLFSDIEKYKADIIELGGGIDEETGVPVGKDNQDVGAEYLVVKGYGTELKDKINKYKSNLISLINPEDTSVINGIEKLLATPPHIDYENVESPWENGISEYLPLAAVTANLTNIQSYIRNSESQAINYLLENIGINEVKVNKILATSIAQSSYVLQGDEYSADIFLAASDTTQDPIVIVGDYDIIHYENTGEINFTGKKDTIPVLNGMGRFKVKTTETGNHTWGGIMKVPHPNPKRKGEFLSYPFVKKYTVAAPSAVISSDQLNIMYIGLENEISVSAPGIKSEDLKVIASNDCEVKEKGSGKYTFKPKRGGRIEITVFANINGENKVVSKQTWKSTSLPKPFIFTPGVKYGLSSSTSLATVLKQVGAKPKYGKSFPISSTPKIISAEISYRKGNEITPLPKLINGKIIDRKIANIIKGLKKGNKVEIKMQAKGADKITHTIFQKITIK
tara:strand:- start:27175 stop:28785 length:1611 start_codon:yes stop_codon:yes gene_type:complete